MNIQKYQYKNRKVPIGKANMNITKVKLYSQTPILVIEKSHDFHHKSTNKVIINLVTIRKMKFKPTKSGT